MPNCTRLPSGSILLVIVNMLRSVGRHSALRKNRPLINLEREPLRYCKGHGNVTLARPLLMFSKVAFGEHVNILKDVVKVIYHTYSQTINGSLSKNER